MGLEGSRGRDGRDWELQLEGIREEAFMGVLGGGMVHLRRNNTSVKGIEVMVSGYCIYGTSSVGRSSFVRIRTSAWQFPLGIERRVPFAKFYTRD